MTIRRSLTLAALLVSALAATAAANATDTLQVMTGNAPRACEGALDTYKVDLRTRPLALVNEGSNSKFINCFFEVPQNSYGVESFQIRIHNYSAAPIAVPCTGVAGVEDGPRNSYYQKLVAVPAFGATTVQWVSSVDNLPSRKRWMDTVENGAPDQNVGLQCLLPVQSGFGKYIVSYRAK